MTVANFESKILEAAIFEQFPRTKRVFFDHGHVLIADDTNKITRYALSPEAKRIALLEREGRPLNIRLGKVTLLVPPT